LEIAVPQLAARLKPCPFKAASNCTTTRIGGWKTRAVFDRYNIAFTVPLPLLLRFLIQLRRSVGGV